MIIFKIDMTDSTRDLERRGHGVTVEIRKQLTEFISRMFRDAVDASLRDLLSDSPKPKPSIRFIGERQGDGIMFGAPRTHALTMLRSAMEIQAEPAWQHPTWRPLRCAAGIAEVSWDGEPYAPGSVPNGRDIHIISRILEPEQCPPGSVVITEPLLRAAREYDHLLAVVFQERHAELKGLEGIQIFGVVPPRPPDRLTPLRSRWQLLVGSRMGTVVMTLGALAWGLIVLRQVTGWRLYWLWR